MSSRHRKPISGRRIIGGSALVTGVVALLTIGVLSAVSFARPDHSFAPPTEAKFISNNAPVVHDVRPHPRVVLADFSARQTIIVQRGQTLSSIAARQLGSASRWPILWWDNQSRISNPNILRVGMHIHFGRWHRVRPWLSRRAMAAIPKPKPAPVAAAPTSTQSVASAPAASAASYSGAPGSFQACVIERESGGNPRAVNPSSGAGGLYQFLPSTWAALGFPGLPEYASVAMQNTAFEKAYAESGTSPWAPYDGC